MTRLRAWLARPWPGRLARAAPLVAVLLVAGLLRFWGLDWDRGILAHPDERRIMLVARAIHWPQPWDWSLVLSPRSPLNPRFFAYGSFPIYLLRLVGAAAGVPPARLYLVGRALSALCDLLTVALIYRIGRELGGRRSGILAAAFLAVAVLPIQLAHFFTVEPLLTLLCALAVYQALRVARTGSLRAGLLGGLVTGLALATKTSAFPLFLVSWAAWAIWALRLGVVRERPAAANPPLAPDGSRVAAATAWSAEAPAPNRTAPERAEPPQLGRVLLGILLGGVAALFVFLAAEPYSLIDWFRFMQAMAQESAMASGRVDLPYTRQFLGTLPYLYPLQQLVLWSLGLPLGLAVVAGLLWLMVRAWRERRREDGVILAWIVPYLAIMGGMYARFPRYLSPLIPWLCLAAALALAPQRASPSLHRTGRWRGIVAAAVLAPTLLYALAFVSLYGRTHPWLEAGAWLCRTAPAGSTLAVEYWGDPLPVAGTTGCDGDFRFLWLDLFAPDDADKLDRLVESLGKADYVVLASQRLYGTIGRLDERYPLSSAYYRLLFGERLGFRLVDVRSNYPRLGPLAIVDEPLDGASLPRPALLDALQPAPLTLNLGRADESYAVYDHPRTLIFRKEQALPASELRALLLAESKRTLP